MSVTLSQILSLVGTLDDTPGVDTPRERFRHFLEENVNEVGQLRDYIGECIRNAGDPYNKALQDLVNHLGHLLGFQVVFGRYRGIQGAIGFDGHWKSSESFHVVVEVKTTEVYATNTATLVDYINRLISEKKIPDSDSALGLYVIGRPTPEIRQLDNAIVAEKRTQQLRIISVERLLSLREMMNGYDIGHKDILSVLKPSGPTLDPLVDLMERIIAGQPPAGSEDEKLPEEKLENQVPETSDVISPAYWLTPVKSDTEQTSEDVIQRLVGQNHVYAFGERTPGRRNLKPGDWICFYATGKGVIAHASVTSAPINQPHPRVRNNEIYPYTFNLGETSLYLDNPIVIDAELRSRLDDFKGRDLTQGWSWFVQSMRKITEHDFNILTKGVEE